MPKTIDDLMKHIRAEARAAGPAAVRQLRALDKAMASIAAQELALLRAKKRLSQAELGRRAQVQPAEVSRILGGKSNPRMQTVERLARVLGAEVRVVASASPRSARAPSSAPRRGGGARKAGH